MKTLTGRWILAVVVILSLVTLVFFDFAGPVGLRVLQGLKSFPFGQELPVGSTGQLDLGKVGRPGGLQYCFATDSDMRRFDRDFLTHDTNDQDVLIMSATFLHDGATVTALDLKWPNLRVHVENGPINSADCWIARGPFFKNVHVARKR